MSNPQISVIIPSFNQGQYIERTLLSILKQDYYGDVQVIVSDGGSTDNTVDILKKYDNQIIWWSEKDNGYADAVNKGFKKATGDICAIQSSDDYYLKDAFRQVTESFSLHPDASLICGREVLQEPDGRIWGGYVLPDIITPRGFLLDHPFPGIFQHTTFFRRRYFELSGGLRPQFDMCADADLFYRLLHFSDGFFLNKYTAVYQKHALQRTVTQTMKFRDKLIGMVDSCKNDKAYSIAYNPTEDEMNRFRTFVKLFYLQFESSERAIKYAQDISDSSSMFDKRISNLADHILATKVNKRKYEDNFLKKSQRILNRIFKKYFQREIISSDPEMPFSEVFDVSWWAK